MEFLEAREALHNGKEICKEAMTMQTSEHLVAGVVVASEEYLRSVVAQGVREGLRQALADVQNPARTRVKEKEAAAYLGVAQSTLRTWRCLKIGPKYSKAGRTVWYSKADMDAYLARMEYHTTQSFKPIPAGAGRETR